MKATGTSPDGQFFPFVSAADVYTDTDDGKIALNPRYNRVPGHIISV